MKFIFAVSGPVLVDGQKSVSGSSEGFWQGIEHGVGKVADLAGEGARGAGSLIADKALAPIGQWFVEHLSQVGHILNENSAEITTLAVLMCGFAIMIAPMVGLNSSKWYGRLAGSLLFGATWRMLLHA